MQSRGRHRWRTDHADFRPGSSLPIRASRRGMTLGVRAAVFDAEGRILLVRHSYVPRLVHAGRRRRAGRGDAGGARPRTDRGGRHRPHRRAPAVRHLLEPDAPRSRDHVALYVCRDWRAAHEPPPRNHGDRRQRLLPTDSLPADTTRCDPPPPRRDRRPAASRRPSGEPTGGLRTPRTACRGSLLSRRCPRSGRNRRAPSRAFGVMAKSMPASIRAAFCGDRRAGDREARAAGCGEGDGRLRREVAEGILPGQREPRREHHAAGGDIARDPNAEGRVADICGARRGVERAGAAASR